MIRLQKMMASTFMLGLISALFYTFGLLSWTWYGVGLYRYEANLLLVWIFIMFGTSMYYGIILMMLYPDECKKRWHAKRIHHM